MNDISFNNFRLKYINETLLMLKVKNFKTFTDYLDKVHQTLNYSVVIQYRY